MGKILELGKAFFLIKSNFSQKNCERNLENGYLDSNKSNTYVQYYVLMLLKLFGLKYENSTHFLRLLFAQFNIFFLTLFRQDKKNLLVSTIRACNVLFRNSLGKILFGLLLKIMQVFLFRNIQTLFRQDGKKI